MLSKPKQKSGIKSGERRLTPQCDEVREIIGLGGKEAKRIIRRTYPDLPER